MSSYLITFFEFPNGHIIQSTWIKGSAKTRKSNLRKHVAINSKAYNISFVLSVLLFIPVQNTANFRNQTHLQLNINMQEWIGQLLLPVTVKFSKYVGENDRY